MICGTDGGSEQIVPVRDIVVELSNVFAAHQQVLTTYLEDWAAIHSDKLNHISEQISALNGSARKTVRNEKPPEEAGCFPSSETSESVYFESRAEDTLQCGAAAGVRFHATASNAESQEQTKDAARQQRLADLAKVGGEGIFEEVAPEESETKKRRSVSGHVMIYDRLRKCIGSTEFEVFCGAVNIANACIIGIETEYMSVNDETSFGLELSQHLVNLWFLIELLLRMHITGFRQFFSLKGVWKWNVFDLVLVTLWGIEIALGGLNTRGVTMTRIFRAMRLVRLLRVLRIFRSLRAVIAFRKMVYAFTNSMSTLVVSLLLLVFEMFFFAVVIVQGVNSYKLENKNTWSPADMDLHDSFGTMGRAYYSLYMAVSQGKSWGYILDTMHQLHPLYAALFITHISVTMFGVLNVMTAVFVESAMQSTARHRDLLVQEKQKIKDVYLRHIKAIFRQIDQDESGAISLPEIENIFLDDTMSHLLEALEITAFDARSMFKLLDHDGSGLISIEEFCDGCLRLKGEAKSFDIQCLIFENQRLITKTTALMGHLEQSLMDLQDTMTAGTASINKTVRRTFKSSQVAAERRLSQSGEPVAPPMMMRLSNTGDLTL